jgi:hypothetical protein
MTRSPGTLLVSLGLTLLFTSLAIAQSKTAEPPLLFRREYVPKSLLERDAKGLIPVKRAEFDSLLKAAQAEGQRGVPRAWIEGAEFQAEQTGDQIVGKAKLHIQTNSANAELLELPQLRFLVRRAVWEGETPRVATVGAAETGKVYVVVDRPGTLALDWVLPARRSAWGDVAFDFPVLQASRATLAMELPTDWRLDASAGIVQRSPADDPALRRWQVELGGVREAKIRLAASSGGGASSVVLVRESTTCKVLADELETQSHFRLDIHRQPLPRMELELLGDWVPTEIRQGDKRVPFEITAREGQPSLAVVRFDPPMEGVNRRLSIAGKQPIKIDARLSVPRARILGSTWLEGRLAIQPGGGWELTQWELRDASPAPILTAMEPTASPESHWQLQEPEAQIAFTARRRPTRLKVASGTTTRIDDEAATGRVVCDFTATGDPVFALQGELDPTWILDSIDTVPVQRLEDWEVTTEAGRQRVKIKLRDSVQAAGGVRLLIFAHRTPPSRNEFPAQQLRPIRWQADESQGQVAVVADSRWHAELTGASREQLDPADLLPAESDRLQLSEEVSLLVDEAALEGTQVKLVEEPVKFAAHWESTITAEAQQIRQEVRLRVEPDSSLMERFKVLVKPPVGKDCTWKLEGEDVAPLEARLLRTGDAALDEEWEIVLHRPRRTAFTVTASLSTRERQRYPVPLFRCVEARRQTATLALLPSDSASLVAERSQGLEPIWPGPQFSAALAAWRYDPSQVAALVLRPASAAELGQLLSIERATLVTQVTDQQLLHEVTYRLRCQQPQTMQFVLPAAAVYQEAFLADRRTDVRVAENMVSVLLPRLTQPTDLVVRFRSPQNMQWAVARVPAAWPFLGRPVGEQRWRVIVPNRYRAWLARPEEASLLQRIGQRLCGPLPGFESAPASDDASPNAAWGSVELAFDDAATLPQQVTLLRSDTLSSVSWSLLLLAWLVVGTLGLHHRRLLTVLIALGLLSLSLPTAFDPLGRMVLLGTLLGLVTRGWRGGMLFRRRTAPMSPEASSSSPAVATVCLLVIATASLSQGFAQEAPSEKPVIHRVVLPVDEQGKEIDDYVYMSERFFAELFTRTRPETPSGPAYLFLDAAYQAFPTADAHRFERMDASLRVEVLHAPAIVKIPCSRADCLVDADQFRLEDRIVPVRWSAEDDALLVTISTLGEHRLQFTARPNGVDEEFPARWELRLPTTPFTRLTADRLEGGADVRVTPSFVKSAPVSPRDDLAVELANQSLVSLSTRPNEAGAASVAAEQLLWVNLWRGAAVVEGRWRFRSDEGTIEAATIDLDGELELIATNANQPFTARWQHADGKATLAWVPREPTEEIVVEASFLWKHAATGDRVLPRIEPQATRIDKRWLAVDTFDPDERRRLAAENRNLLDVQTFATVWNAEIAPAHVRRLDLPGPVRLSLPVVVNRPTYDATTRWEIGPAQAKFAFTAQLQAAEQPLASLRLQVPLGCRLDSVEVGVAGQYRSTPWLAASAEEILLLPTSPLQTGHTLRLQGTLPVTLDQQQTVAWPSVKNATLLEHNVELWRKPTAQVEVKPTDPAVRQEVLSASAEPRLFPVAQLSADGTATLPVTLQWRVKPNHPRTVGILVTTLRREGDQWLARLDAYLAVRGGRVDAFRLESSPYWQPTTLLAGEGRLETVSVDERLRTLQVHPPAGAQDRFHFACEAVIASGAKQKVELPQIRLLGAEATQAFLRLPMGAEFDWSLSGVQESPLPSSIALPGDNFAIYRVVVPQYAALLNAQADSPAAPEVVCAQLVETKNAQAEHLLRATLVVKPDGRAALPVRLPEGAKFLHARVEQQPVVSQLVGHREMEVPLRSSHLPQVIEIIYSAGPRHEPAPPEIASRTENWRLAHPWQIAPPGEPLADLTLAPSDLLMLLPPAINDHAVEARDSTWARRWLARVRQSQDAMPTDSNDATTAEQREQLQKIASELERLTINASAAEMPTEDEAPSVALPSSSVGGASTRVALLGWLLPCLAWIGMVLLGKKVSALDAVGEWARRWPYLCAVLTGGLLAVLISPFWLGAGLMLVAAAGSLAWPWRALPRP